MKDSRKQNNLSVQYSLHTKIAFNINLVGKKSVGKSSLVLREVKNNFQNLHKVSEGFEFYSKTFHKDSEDILLQIWDTAGQCEYNSMTRNFFRKAAAVILVYDNVNRLQEEIRSVKNQLNQFAHQTVKLCLIRTKIDILPISGQQQMKVKQICDRKFPNEIFYRGQVSAKTNQNVHKYFEDLVDLMQKCYAENQDFRQAVSPSKDSFLLGSGVKGLSPNKRTKKCC